MGMRKLLLILLVFNTAYGQTPMRALIAKHVSGATPDADSIAYVTKVANNGGSLSSTEKTAAGQLIRDLKANGTWGNYYAIYPLLGSSEAAAKVNLKDTANYNLTFYNSPTINGSGVDWNGTSQYANTFFTTDLFSTDSACISYYSFENVSQAGIPMGGADVDIELYLGTHYSFNLTSASDYASNTPASMIGWFVNSRTATGSFTIYKDGASTNTKTATSASGAGYYIYLGARAGGAQVPGFYSTLGCGFATISKGMSSTQISNDYTALQTFLTTLGR